MTDERRVFHVVMVKHITVAVTGRTAQHAADIAMDQNNDHMFQDQWLWAESEVVAIGTEQ